MLGSALKQNVTQISFTWSLYYSLDFHIKRWGASK